MRDALGNEFMYTIYHQKIRGRGSGAPEKTIGADGIFQLELYDRNGKLLRRKGLLFQSKKEWEGKDGKLGGQAENLLVDGDRDKAVVIDFGPSGYTTCSVATAAKAQGNRKQIANNQFSNLSATLGDEFLRCRVGVQDMYYDGDEEILFDPTVDQQFNLADKHVVGTRIQRLT
ncbi:hypothetical protein U8335_26650 [Roseiconus lacunae]|uniref:hypothetical protein n=1 Tax=Roseiconus lacunae TaxID=2605694 RepID=UPI0030890C42|nr:hypothetical protein U8335_26650 [Stieleria sp. HD01]